MPPERSTIATRCLSGRCPRCGRFGLFKHWFRLHRDCPHCSMPLERDESGFYFGTTSIGYVLALLFVVLPVCFFVVSGRLGLWSGVLTAALGSLLLCVLFYPVLLCAVIAFYFIVQPEALEAPRDE